MKFYRRIKPQVDSLFPVTLPMGVDIRLDSVRLPTPVAQELEVQFVPNLIGVRVHLHEII